MNVSTQKRFLQHSFFSIRHNHIGVEKVCLIAVILFCSISRRFHLGEAAGAVEQKWWYAYSYVFHYPVNRQSFPKRLSYFNSPDFHYDLPFLYYLIVCHAVVVCSPLFPPWDSRQSAPSLFVYCTTFNVKQFYTIYCRKRWISLWRTRLWTSVWMGWRYVLLEFTCMLVYSDFSLCKIPQWYTCARHNILQIR